MTILKSGGEISIALTEDELEEVTFLVLVGADHAMEYGYTDDNSLVSSLKTQTEKLLNNE